jgi:5-methylcytosine-specific restriction endonuclease McrA
VYEVLPKHFIGHFLSLEITMVVLAMFTNLIAQATNLSDRELLGQLERLAQREREATAALIAHLAVMDERRLYLTEGFSCLFLYCTQVLHYSEHAACNRMEVARAACKYPVILELLADGSLSLTTVRLLAPELTPANHRDLLKAARYKGKREVVELIAGLRPQPAVASTVRRLPTRTASLVFRPAPKADASGDQAPALETQATLEIRPPARPVVVPLSPERFKIQFTATKETNELLRRAQDLLRHKIPNGDVGEVMAKALRLLVRELEKEKIAATDRPRGSRASDPQSRHIPAEVKRKVWARDGGQCAFVAHNGRRCAERSFLEFHHVDPHAVGGKATMDNIELRCRAHNVYESDLYFGPPGSGQVAQ